MGVEFRHGRVLNIMPMEHTCYLSIGTDMEEAGAVILATGVSRGKKFPGEAEFLGRGVSYCATCDGMLYRDKQVVVVGLAPDAAEEANFLQGLGCRVTYVSGKAPEGLDPAIAYVRATKLEIVGEASVTALRAGDEEIPCQCVFLLRHAIPPTDLLPGAGAGKRLYPGGPGDEDQPAGRICRRRLHRAAPPALKSRRRGPDRRTEGRRVSRRAVRGKSCIFYLFHYKKEK